MLINFDECTYLLHRMNINIFLELIFDIFVLVCCISLCALVCFFPLYRYCYLITVVILKLNGHLSKLHFFIVAL